MADLLQFVDSIQAFPTVRLDLNTPDSGPWSLQYQGTDFSPPRLRRAIAQTLLVDGATIPAAAYDNRIVRLRLDLITSTVDDAATQLQKLAVELNRDTNFLKWKPGTTQEVFFRTMRSDMTQVVEMPGGGTLRHVDVEVLAEPFAYGLLQALPNVTVNNDPLAGSNPMRWLVTGVKGDVETPLILRFPFSDVFATGPAAIAVRTRSGAVPFVLQAESMTTSGSDTALQSNDPVMSGAGSNYTRTTFATTATLAVRLLGNVFPASASIDNRGLYRVFVRYRRSSATGVINMQLVQTFGGTGPLVATKLTTGRSYADLGLVSLPSGLDPREGFAGLTAPAVRGNIVDFWAERISGSSNLDIDVFLFVPADEVMALVKLGASTGPTTTVLDGTINTIYQLGASGEVYSREAALWSGGLPLVWPNVTNTVVFVLNAAGPVAGDDSITESTAVEQSYYPRYLYVRPVST